MITKHTTFCPILGVCTVTRTEIAPALRVLIDSRAEWIDVTEYADALSLSIWEACAVIGQFVTDGYLCIGGESTRNPRVTFTAWGAAVLGLERSEADARHVYKWVITGKPNPNPPRRPRPRREHVPIDQVADSAPGPLEQMLLEEERHEPVPRIILTGPELTPWDEHRARKEKRPDRHCKRCRPQGKRKRKSVSISCRCGHPAVVPAETSCPACHGENLSRSTYCARCCRWGADHGSQSQPATLPAEAARAAV